MTQCDRQMRGHGAARIPAMCVHTHTHTHTHTHPFTAGLPQLSCRLPVGWVWVCSVPQSSGQLTPRQGDGPPLGRSHWPLGLPFWVQTGIRVPQEKRTDRLSPLGLFPKRLVGYLGQVRGDSSPGLGFFSQPLRGCLSTWKSQRCTFLAHEQPASCVNSYTRVGPPQLSSWSQPQG